MRTQKKQNRRKPLHYFVVLLNMVLIASSLSAASLLYYANDRASAVSRVALDDALASLADERKGQRVMNILLVGSDSSNSLDSDDPLRIGRGSQQLGDVIIIAHIDERSGELALLSLPRDVWVEIPSVGRNSRINRAFDTGGPVSLIEAIETNFQIPIHHYVNVDFAGFQGLVEAVGSVDVYFPEPARDWNVNANPPRTQTGFIVEEAGCQTLDADQALAYVRSRYYQTQSPDGTWSTDLTSDFGRIRRQQDFLRRLMNRAVSLGARNPFVLTDLINTGLENVTIDENLTPQLLKDLASTYQGFNPEKLQTYSLPVSDLTVGNDPDLLQTNVESAEPILKIFRGAEFSSPETVPVKVFTEDPLSNDSFSVPVSDELNSLGFTVSEKNKSNLKGPTEKDFLIQHGPDGLQAAELVADALNGTYEFQELNGILGRNIQLTQKVVVDQKPEPKDVENVSPKVETTTQPNSNSTTPSANNSTEKIEAVETTIAENIVEVEKTFC